VQILEESVEKSLTEAEAEENGQLNATDDSPGKLQEQKSRLEVRENSGCMMNVL